MDDVETRARKVAELVEDKPEYEDIFESILTWHDEGYQAVSRSGDGIEQSQTPIHATRLSYLRDNAILDTTYDSTSTTRYQPMMWECPTCETLNERRKYVDTFEVECLDCGDHHDVGEIPIRVDDIRRGLEIANKGGIDEADAKEFEVDVDLNSLFDNIIGYDDIKTRFQRAIKSRSVRQSIMLVGPRASAKTLFLRNVTRIQNTARISGASLTPAGLEDVLMDRPSFVIIDEFDEVQDPGIYSVLMNYQDATMDYSITKSGKQDDISIDAKAPVFVSANNTDRIPEPNIDRFWDFYFDRYSRAEFRDVCVNTLPEKFDIDEDVAEYLAYRLRDWSDDASVRDAERVAEVVETKDDIDEEIRVMDQYDR